MEKFILTKTNNTPEINFNPSAGELKIEGRSIPENPGEIYDVLIEKLNEYYENPQKLTLVDIKLEYINSGSAKYLLELLRLVRRNFKKGHDCLVRWHYEEDDESIEDLGQHFMKTVKIPFKLIDYY